MPVGELFSNLLSSQCCYVCVRVRVCSNSSVQTLSDDSKSMRCFLDFSLSSASTVHISESLPTQPPIAHRRLIFQFPGVWRAFQGKLKVCETMGDEHDIVACTCSVCEIMTCHYWYFFSVYTASNNSETITSQRAVFRFRIKHHRFIFQEWEKR